jgi:hypothetical protein
MLLTTVSLGVTLVSGCADESTPDNDDTSEDETGGSKAPGGDGGSFDNVAACEELVDSCECGEMDLSMYVQCDSFAMYGCDISDYFDCLSDEVRCQNDVLDPSGIQGCVGLASCE